MNLTDRTQKVRYSQSKTCSEMSSKVLSSSKRKGISLSKLINEKNRNREHSFIKLSARNKKPLAAEKRQIKLIVKPKPQKEQDFYLLMESSKENNVQAINFKRSGEFVKTVQIHINTAPNIISYMQLNKKVQNKNLSKQKLSNNVKKLIINSNRTSPLEMLRL